LEKVGAKNNKLGKRAPYWGERQKKKEARKGCELQKKRAKAKGYGKNRKEQKGEVGSWGGEQTRGKEPGKKETLGFERNKKDRAEKVSSSQTRRGGIEKKKEFVKKKRKFLFLQSEKWLPGFSFLNGKTKLPLRNTQRSRVLGNQHLVPRNHNCAQ